MLTSETNIVTIFNQDIFKSIKKRASADYLGSSVIVPHVCNNIGLFGAGFAHAVSEAYPEVKENYLLLGKTFLQKNPGHVQFINVYTDAKYKHNIVFANMISQNGVLGQNNKRPINYAYLVKSMLNVKQYIMTNYDQDAKVEIHAPKFGSGLARGNWNFISDLIEDIWGNFPVFIYDFNNRK